MAVSILTADIIDLIIRFVTDLTQTYVMVIKPVEDEVIETSLLLAYSTRHISVECQ